MGHLCLAVIKGVGCMPHRLTEGEGLGNLGRNILTENTDDNARDTVDKDKHWFELQQNYLFIMK